MSRFLLAGSFALAAAAALAAAPSIADSPRDGLQRNGKAIGAAWTDTGRFDSLTAAGMDNVRLVTGEHWRIRASGDARAVAQLRFMVKDGALVVGRVSGGPERSGKAQIEVTAPAIHGVTAAGSGNVDVERLTGASAVATIAGSSHTLVRKVESKTLSATIAGSGSLDLRGRSDRADITIAGSGAFDGKAFTAGSASVTVAGSGSGRFRSPGPVSATIAGSGSVRVTGTTTCSATRLGSGRLICTRDS
ncbi:MAG: DUF2807 domain-containing protein [Altererythrobacter sp.]|nr:DUF2807 domain-containing protein [Altererythrobacter sp.]